MLGSPAAKPATSAWSVRTFDIFVRSIIMSVGLAAVFIALSVCYEVFARSVLGVPVIWVEEVTAYLVGYITFVGMGAALYQGSHVRIEFIVDNLQGSALTITRVTANLLMVALAGLLLNMSWTYWFEAWRSGERSTSLLSVPLWIPYLCFLVGSAILLIVQLTQTVSAFTSWQRNNPSEPT